MQSIPYNVSFSVFEFKVYCPAVASFCEHGGYRAIVKRKAPGVFKAGPGRATLIHDRGGNLPGESRRTFSGLWAPGPGF